MNLADRRHISPPLHINICENNTSLLGSPQGEHHRPLLDFNQRRHGRGKHYNLDLKILIILICIIFIIDVRVSPVHFQQHSPPYYGRQSSDEGIKSESPSRKRRRLSRSGHHIELAPQPASPPRRSPRQHPPSTHTMQVNNENMIVFNVELHKYKHFHHFVIVIVYHCKWRLYILKIVNYELIAEVNVDTIWICYLGQMVLS